MSIVTSFWRPPISGELFMLFRKTPASLFMAAILAIIGVGLPNLADANPYFNSPSENCDVPSGNCSAHPSWVFADDFDDGSWYATKNDPNAAANDGWLGCNDINCGNPQPPAVSPNGAGRGGSGYAAMSSPSGGDGGFSAMGLHGFYPNNATYRELWIRFYIRFLSGYQFNDNQKFFSLIRSAYQGGIDYGGVGSDLSTMPVCPVWTCNFLNEDFLRQNQGNNITMQPGSNWYFVEWHIKLNDNNVRNGIWRMWINNCGSTGVCTGSPTLRASHTNVGWIGGGSHVGNIGSMWMDIWGNPADVGTMYIDNMVVATTGPIGFVGSSGTLPAPMNLRVE